LVAWHCLPDRRNYFTVATVSVHESALKQSSNETAIFHIWLSIPNSWLGRRPEHSAFPNKRAGDPRLMASASTVDRTAATNGRVLAVDASIVDGRSSHCIFMPQCHHGEPGRAGNGEELGGLNGLRLYHQRVAVHGSSTLIARIS
jgi:hypothetical protein